MGNIGRASTGCARCRKRRIKCDEARPGCERCKKVGQPCPGYDRSLKVVFFNPPDAGSKEPKPADHARRGRPQDRHAALQKRGARHQDTGLIRESETSNVVLHRSTPFKCLDSTDSPIPSCLRSDLQSRALALFIDSFTHDGSDSSGTPGFLDFLPSLYQDARSDSCLHDCLAAVATVNFMNRYKAANLLGLSKKSYLRGVSALNQALSDPVQTNSDQCLLSVWLLSLYELLIPELQPLVTSERTAWTNHIFGVMSLLLARGSRQLRTQAGRQLFYLMHTNIVVMFMMGGQAPPPALEHLVREMLLADPESFTGPAMVSHYLQGVAILRADLEKLVATYQMCYDDHVHAELKSKIFESTIFDQAKTFEKWTSQTPLWKIHHAGMDSQDMPTPHTDRVYFSSYFVMTTWISYLAARLLLIQSIMDAIRDSVSSPLDDERSYLPNTLSTTDLQSSLETVADTMIGMVGYATGNIAEDGKSPKRSSIPTTIYTGTAVGAFQLFWPMGSILACRNTTIEQKILAAGALGTIGQKFGIAQALRYANPQILNAIGA